MADTPLAVYRRRLEEEKQKTERPKVKVPTVSLDPSKLGQSEIKGDLGQSALEPEPLKRITPLQVLNVGSQAAGRAIGSLVDKPGHTDAVFEAAKGVRDAFTPGAQMTSPSLEIEKRTGKKMPTLGSLALDIVSDPTNLIAPEKLAAALPAAAMMGGIKRVDDVARVGSKIVDDLGRVVDDAAEVVPKVSERVPGLGTVQDAITDGGIFPEPKLKSGMKPPTTAQLDADDELLHPFLERHAGLGKETTQELKDIFFEADNFWDARRMGMTWEEAAKMADDVNVSISLPKGTALNQEQTLALRSKAMGLLNRAKEVGEELFDIEKLPIDQLQALGQKHNVVGGNPVLQLKALRAEAWLQAKAGLQTLAGVRSEAGRALNSYKQIRRAREMGDDAFIQKALERDALPDQVYDALGKFTDKTSQYKFLRSLTQPNAQDLWRWYYISNLLSGPMTHARNIFGNTTRIASEMAATTAAPVVGKFRKGGDQAFFGEAVQQFPGLLAGMKQGFERASFMFKNGFSVNMAEEFADTAPEAFGGRLLPNVVGRALNASDEFFRTVGFNMELYKGAYAQAAKEGLSSDALWARAAEIVDNPTPELVKQSKKLGAELVFRQPGGEWTQFFRRGQNLGDKAGVKLGEAINRVGDRMVKSDVTVLRKAGELIETGSFLGGLAKMPFGTFIMPFISTPINILRAGAHFSPAGFGIAAMKSGRESTQIASRAAVGSGLMAYAMYLALDGRLTGSGPGDAAERDAFYAEKRPNSIKIGDRWVSYQMMAPLAFPLSTIANAVEAAKYAKDDVSRSQIASNAIFKVANSVLDQSYLSGMLGLIEAISASEREEYKRDAVFGRMATGFIPASGALRGVRNTMDDVVRNPEGIVENVKAAMPVLSESVPARVDLAGRTIRKPGNAFQRAIVPVEIAPAQQDPVRSMLKASDTYYTNPQTASLGLSREHEVLFKKVLGAAIEQQLQVLAKDREFMSLPVEQRRLEIEEIKRDVSSQVRDYFKAKYGRKEP